MDTQFKVGSSFQLKPKGGPQVKIKILKVEPERVALDNLGLTQAQYSILAAIS